MHRSGTSGVLPPGSQDHQRHATPPIVTLTQTYPESPAPAEQLVVFGQVSDPDGIVDNDEDFDHNGDEL